MRCCICNRCSNKDVKVLAEAPADALKTPVIYPVAALKKSKNKDAADKFVKFLQSEKALKVLDMVQETIEYGNKTIKKEKHELHTNKVFEMPQDDEV